MITSMTTPPTTDRLSRPFFKSQILLLLIVFTSTLGGSAAWAAGDPLSGQPDHFKFSMPGRDPGERTWTRKGDTWTEVLPSKNTNHFIVRKPFVLKGVNGILVRKIEEPDFFVFIPTIYNMRTGKMQLWCVKGTNGPWTMLGNMTDVGPVLMD